MYYAFFIPDTFFISQVFSFCVIGFSYGKLGCTFFSRAGYTASLTKHLCMLCMKVSNHKVCYQIHPFLFKGDLDRNGSWIYLSHKRQARHYQVAILSYLCLTPFPNTYLFMPVRSQ